MIPHRGTEITDKKRASVFFAALCGIFFMIPHRGTEITEKTEPPCSLRLCAGFFYDHTEAQRSQRKTEPPCSLRDIGLLPSPESVIIKKKSVTTEQETGVRKLVLPDGKAVPISAGAFGSRRSAIIPQGKSDDFPFPHSGFYICIKIFFCLTYPPRIIYLACLNINRIKY